MVAIVTGGAAGIGFAYAQRFLAEGARVVVADIADPVAAAGKLGGGDRVLGVRVDVSDVASGGAWSTRPSAASGASTSSSTTPRCSPRSSPSASTRSPRPSGTACSP